jgi:hypothetical protein
VPDKKTTLGQTPIVENEVAHLTMHLLKKTGDKLGRLKNGQAFK